MAFARTHTLTYAHRHMRMHAHTSTHAYNPMQKQPSCKKGKTKNAQVTDFGV